VRIKTELDAQTWSKLVPKIRERRAQNEPPLIAPPIEAFIAKNEIKELWRLFSWYRTLAGVRIKSYQDAARRSLLALVGILLIITCACKVSLRQVSLRPGYIADDKRSVDEAIGALHQRLNAHEYKQIYDDAHASLKASQTEADYSDLLKKLREGLGEVQYVTDKWINVIVGPSIEIRAIYNSTFDKGDATEMFVFVRDADAIRLLHYQVSPGTTKPNVPSWHYTESATCRVRHFL
jgi:hypothetical protein